MTLRLSPFALALTLMTAPVAAQDRSAPLLEMLGRLPAAVAGTDLPDGIEFSDTRAGTEAMLLPPEGMREDFRGPAGGAVRALPSAWTQVLGPSLGAGWQERTGFAPWEIETVLHVSAPPLQLAVLDLVPDAAALARALDAPEAGPGALVRVILLPRGAVLAPDGMADWGAAMIADLPDGSTDRAVLGLTYPTRAQAKAAATTMVARWSSERSGLSGQPFAGIRPAATVSAGVTGEGPFVALFAIDMPVPPETSFPRGWGVDLILNAWMPRDLVFLPSRGSEE